MPPDIRQRKNVTSAEKPLLDSPGNGDIDDGFDEPIQRIKLWNLRTFWILCFFLILLKIMLFRCYVSTDFEVSLLTIFKFKSTAFRFTEIGWQSLIGSLSQNGITTMFHNGLSIIHHFSRTSNEPWPWLRKSWMRIF